MDENNGTHAPACDGGIRVHNAWAPKKSFLRLQYNVWHLTGHAEKTQST